MKLLILGGTAFLGRHLVEGAAARGHELTLFNRGERNPGLFPELEQIRGDRDGGLDGLRGRSWDAAVDTSGYVPRIVGASARLLADAVEHYTFVSSISVYGDLSMPPSEASPVGTLEDEAVEEVGGDTYGPLKALCERAVEEALPGRALIIRPGLIVGPWDPTGRFTYWPVRIAKGGDVLVPSPPDAPVQVIHARDLAEWILDLAERRVTGVFNASGPETPLTMSAVLEECRRVSGSDARFAWAEPELLAEHGVEEWMGLPLWLADPAYAGMSQANVSRAVAAGLTFRPLAQTIEETLAWARAEPADWPAGIDETKEGEVLASLASA